MGGGHKALVLFVSAFSAPLAPGELPGPTIGYPNLDGAADAAQAIARQLARIGYAVSLQAEPSAEELGDFVSQVVKSGGSDELRVIYVISHADVAATVDKLHVIGRDSSEHPNAIVERWVESVEFAVDGPRALFVLDTCYSGRATVMPWADRRTTTEPRAIVLAASSWDHRAYEFRLTRALSELLADEAALDAFPSLPHLKWDLVARALRDKIALLSEGSDYPQYPTSTPLDPAVIDMDTVAPFFPNPRFARPNGVDIAREGSPATIAPFVDGVDVGHFMSRAMGRRRLPAGAHGLFRGRSREIGALSDWLDRPVGVDHIRLVTGEPGSGKSALLGVLVCASLRKLRKATAAAWEHLPRVPAIVPHIAAVHARGRDTQEIVGSIGAQLKLDSRIQQRKDKSESSARALVTVLSAMKYQPTIVIDALDEAADVGELSQQLLLPLINARRRDGSVACRLIIGTRSGDRWPAADALLAFAEPEQQLNLSKIDTRTLKNDLQSYVQDALATHEAWLLDSCRPLSDIANEVATKLVLAHRAGEWGEFLVAGLFVDHLLGSVAPQDGHALETALARVPVTLADVLELDLATDGAQRARALLTAFALGKGEGMPLSLASKVAQALLNEGPWSSASAAAVRDRILFYLRVSADTDGSALYRPFHEGIVQRLASSGGNSVFASVVDAMLESRRIGGATRWDSASPYLTRHFLEHASDAGRLAEVVHDPEVLVMASPMEVERVARPGDSILHTIYAAARLTGTSPAQRRDLLAVMAAEYGEHDLARRLVHHPTSSSRWVPTWTILGLRNSAPDRRSVTGDWVTAASLVRTRGQDLAVSGHESGAVVMRDITSGLRAHTVGVGSSPISAIAAFEYLAHSILVVGTLDGGLAVCDVESGEVTARIAGRRRAIATVQPCIVGGRLWIAALEVDGALRAWGTRGEGEVVLAGAGSRLLALSMSVDGAVLVAGGGASGLRRWDLSTYPPRELSPQHASRFLSAIAISESPSGELTAVGTEDGSIMLRGLDVDDEPVVFLGAHRGAVRSMSFATIEGQGVVLSGGDDGVVRAWDVQRGVRTSALLYSVGPITQIDSVPSRGAGIHLLVRCGGRLANYESRLE